MDGEQCPVIILAGGKSTRLGRDKASELLEGRTLLQHVVDATASLVDRYVIVTRKGQSLPQVEAQAPLTTVEDAYPDTGPLGGIYTGLAGLTDGATAPPLRRRRVLSPSKEGGGRGKGSALVLACDMPLLQPGLLRELLRLAPGHDAVVPVRDSLPEPLCAVYSTACAAPARRLLESRAYRVAGMLEEVDALLVPEAQWRRLDPDGLSFLNVNREEDLEAVRALMSRP